MAIKNLGHYEGDVEDITINSLEFKRLSPIHQQLITLNQEKQFLNSRIESIDQKIDSLKSSIENEVKSGKIKWAWVWFKRSTRVKWKEEFLKACGHSMAEKIIEKYQTKEYPQIGIRYIDPIPESIKQIKENPPKLPIIKYKLKNN